MRHAVIMAGGSGTRFWPLSRRSFPKQFLTLSGTRSLIQSTFDRCRPDIAADRFWVVTNAVQAGVTRDQLPEIPGEQILIEPCGRNTAPCIGLAAIHLLRQDPEAVMVIMPADHVIGPDQEFRRLVERAVQLTEADPTRLVLFGVRPNYPATGFGYIERGPALPNASDAYSVASFREKPDLSTAERYIESGKFYWNCGIFVWRADVILERLRAFEPTLAARLETLAGHIGREDWPEALAEEFPRMPSISIDYSVLERADNICLLEAPFAWDDVGSWEALSRLHEQDAAGNTTVGPHGGVDTSGCIIRSEGQHLVATAGVEDLIVVHTPDATLVAARRDEDAIRRLVKHLEESGWDHYV
ncbi:MAG: mannose-1-phosphate guanylyltransferase [Planctomycetaceae bacterium]|nr:mannose-1-phosphate guanylyltransferase [Planctomycetaceae bacterium]